MMFITLPLKRLEPAFVIALWIEESGASGVDAYDLGCLGGIVMTSLASLTAF